MRIAWPLLVIGVGLTIPVVGSSEFGKALDRFKQKHPEEYDDASGVDVARAEPRAWLLPVGALIVGPILLLVGLVWLIWVVVSWAI